MSFGLLLHNRAVCVPPPTSGCSQLTMLSSFHLNVRLRRTRQPVLLPPYTNHYLTTTQQQQVKAKPKRTDAISFGELGAALSITQAALNGGRGKRWVVEYVRRKRGAKVDTLVYSPTGIRFSSKPELLCFMRGGREGCALPQRAFSRLPGRHGITSGQAVASGIVTDEHKLVRK